ncbi:MAG: hypothetical protein BWK80_58100, partial [Desulfobacteraceae bacterium IS3]
IKRSVLYVFPLILGMFFLSSAVSFGAIKGDIDNSGKIELQDAILGLQVTAQLRNAADFGYAGNIELPEAIYILRVLSGISGGTARAMLGPLSGATVNVYRLNDLATAIYNRFGRLFQYGNFKHPPIRFCCCSGFRRTGYGCR